jgi:hypothetical protein
MAAERGEVALCLLHHARKGKVEALNMLITR